MGNVAQNQSINGHPHDETHAIVPNESSPKRIDVKNNSNDDIDDDRPKKLSVESNYGFLHRESNRHSASLKKPHEGSHSIRLGASQRRSSALHHSIQLNAASSMMGHSNTRSEEVEKVLSNALSLLHSVMNKQADTEKIQQSDLLNVILYLQKPRNFSTKYSKERFFRAETEYNLRVLLQQNESAGKYFLEYVMLDTKLDEEESESDSDYQQAKANERAHRISHQILEDEDQDNNNEEIETLKDSSSAYDSQKTEESIDIFKRLKTRHAIQRKKTGISLTFGQKCKRFVKDLIPEISKEKIINKSAHALYSKCAKEIADRHSEISFEISKLFKWEFDAFELADVCDTPLTALGLYAMNKFDLFKQCNVSQTTFVAFLYKIEQSYLSNPYHNNIHACDVLSAEIYWLSDTDIYSKLEPNDLFICIIAAAIHDVGHPGTTSDFQIKTHSELANRYNDTSVLENYHLSVAFNVIQQKKTNIFENMDTNIRTRLRQALIQIVFTTDVSKHLNHITTLRELIDELQTTQTLKNSQNIIDKDNTTNKKNEHDRKSVMSKAEIRSIIRNMTVKASDLSNPTRPLEIALKWTDAIMEEFWQQGEKESQLGLTITPIMNRDKPNIEYGQLGFIDHLVIPLFKEWLRFSQSFIIPFNNLIRNRTYWIDKVEKNTGIQSKQLRKKNNEYKSLLKRYHSNHTK